MGRGLPDTEMLGFSLAQAARQEWAMPFELCLMQTSPIVDCLPPNQLNAFMDFSHQCLWQSAGPDRHPISTGHFRRPGCTFVPGARSRIQINDLSKYAAFRPRLASGGRV